MSFVELTHFQIYVLVLIFMLIIIVFLIYITIRVDNILFYIRLA